MRLILPICGGLVFGAGPQWASAQLDNLDKATLIDGLRREGMGELLKHFAQTATFEDPADAQFVLYSQHLYEFDVKFDQALSTGDTTLRTEAVESFNEGLAVLRQLIADFPDHLQRPIWQTDLGELLLLSDLYSIHDYATLFAEFGVMTAEQRAAFERAAPEAMEMLVDADLGLFRTVGDLPKQADFTDKYELTGLWRRVNEEYYQLKTPFYLTHAKHFVALLPDSNRYYQTLGQNKYVPSALQKKTASEERQALWTDAARRLEELLVRQQSNNSVKQPALSLLGRVLLGQGKYTEAIAKLDQAIAMGTANRFDFAARLAKAQALFRSNQQSEAMTQLQAMQGYSLVAQDLRFRLLLTDTVHQLMLEQATAIKDNAARQQALADAYEPYLELFNDENLGDAGEQIKMFVFRRWQENVKPNQSMNELPAVVVSAIGEMGRIAGQNMMAQAQESEDAELFDQAMPKFEQSVTALTELLKRANLSPAVEANARFNLARSKYFLAQGDIDKVIQAAHEYIALGEKLPNETVTQTAMADMVSILRPLHTQQPRPVGVDEVYSKAGAMLLEKMPDSAVAHNERYYYALAILNAAGKKTEAIAVLDALPFGYPDYFLGQAAKLTLMLELPNQDDEALIQQIDENAQALERETENAQGSGDETQQALITSAGGTARLARVDVAMRRGQHEQAVELLQGFEDQYESDPALISFALEKRILSQVEANQFKEAGEQAQRMMARFPDDAAFVIDNVLGKLESMIDGLRQQSAQTLVAAEKRQFEDRATAIATTAVDLAKLLMDWAKTQNLSEEEMVAFELPYTRALRLAGRPDEARTIIESMLTKFDTDPDVLHNALEMYFALGSPTKNEELLIEAGGMANVLIGGLQPPYPPIYWNAWMRRLQINDLLQQYTDDIYFRVLQLEQTDANLGGEPYKSELTRLKVKYQP